MTPTGHRPHPRSARVTAELQAAVRQHQSGRLEDAAAGYHRVLAEVPEDPDALHLLGLIALRAGDPERAIGLIRRALAVLPDFPAAHGSLGNALRAAGRAADAQDSYQRAIALDPNGAAAHHNLALLLCERGDFAGALASARRAVELDPGLAEAHNTLGNALRGLRQFPAAEAALRRAVQLEPSAERYTNLANVLADLGRSEEAERGYQRALERQPTFAAAHYGLGIRLYQRGEVAAAADRYREATALDPGHAAAWQGLGAALRALGHIEEAVEAFRRALAADPDFSEAYRDLAACAALPADGSQAERASALAARADRSPDARAAAAFALGKALDDAGRFDAAFAAYAEANRLYRGVLAASGVRFDGEALRPEVDKTIVAFDSSYFTAVSGWGHPSEQPVFIVGMPRSGTSLIEQIIASHSQVAGIGERQDIGRLAAEFAAAMAASDRARVRSLADGHVRRLQGLGGGALRIADKMPDNLFQLGLIATLFPGARVIFCRRDPRDVCLSCYFQRFAAGRLPFAYDLADCARRFIETERLAAHWVRVLPLRWHEVWYEDVIADLPGESQRLIAFLGLGWEPGCLEFHRTQRVVATASAWQVRQPLYDRSVGRWRHYHRHLAPLGDLLARPGRGPAGLTGVVDEP